METRRKIKLAVFDLDGTLLNTIPDIGAGVNHALRRFGLPERTVDEYKRFVGNGVRDLIARAIPAGTSVELEAAVLAEYRGYYPQHYAEQTAYFPGIQELLTRLMNVGVQVAVLSNKTEATALLIMNHFFPDVPFTFVWGNNGVRPLKPATDAGKMLCETMGLQPCEVAYVGDMNGDMEFGSKMGFHTVGVTWGYCTRERLLEAGAHALADTMDELAETILNPQ